MEWREVEGVPWLEAELPGARAVFSTRRGGASTGAFASLNLGWITGDEPASVYENRRRLARTADFEPANVLTGFQVHGAEILRTEQPAEGVPYLRPPADPPEVDGHATSTPGLAPIVERGAREVKATAAAIGPGIGPCCFEVGEEVLAEFADLGADVARDRMLDLPEVAARKLAVAGVEAVDRAALCTSCNPELFFSHRRDRGETGRQAGAVVAWQS
jgi:copper oxidase (laccase) domain-containing protein